MEERKKNCNWVREAVKNSPCGRRRGESDGFVGRAALVRFLEQMRGVCFIIESRSDSLCLCFCACGKPGRRYSVIFFCCGFCSVILVLVAGEGQSVCVVSVHKSAYKCLQRCASLFVSVST